MQNANIFISNLIITNNTARYCHTPYNMSLTAVMVHDNKIMLDIFGWKDEAFMILLTLFPCSVTQVILGESHT